MYRLRAAKEQNAIRRRRKNDIDSRLSLGRFGNYSVVTLGSGMSADGPLFLDLADAEAAAASAKRARAGNDRVSVVRMIDAR